MLVPTLGITLLKCNDHIYAGTSLQNHRLLKKNISIPSHPVLQIRATYNLRLCHRSYFRNSTVRKDTSYSQSVRKSNRSKELVGPLGLVEQACWVHTPRTQAGIQLRSIAHFLAKCSWGHNDRRKTIWPICQFTCHSNDMKPFENLHNIYRTIHQLRHQGRKPHPSPHHKHQSPGWCSSRW